MERNRGETAIRCLEIAVHPNTKDDEVIAAVNGFRRTADGAPLRQFCLEFAGPGSTAIAAARWKERLDRLDWENLELRRKIEESEAGRTAALHQLQEADQRAQDIAEDLFAAEHRAETAEQRLAEFQGAYGRISGGLSHENLDLRRELEAARRNLAQPMHEPVPPFQNILNAALQRPDPARTSAPIPLSNRPWTA